MHSLARSIIHSTLTGLMARFDSPEARVLLAAIGFQESRFENRIQVPNGPAHGFWQFERGGGVAGVLTHPASRRFAEAACLFRGVPADRQDVYSAIVNDDILACTFARLLLYTDPRALPKIGEVDEAWDYYKRNWRPGKPHPSTWAEMYRRGREAVL
jgi:hypothetical protein